MTFKVPSQYDWLNHVGELPRMTQEGLKILGVRETPGVGNNPIIMGWASEGNVKGYTGDSLAWCGLTQQICAVRAGKVPPAGPLWALNWATWGTPVPIPMLGDIVTFTRPGGGHVAQYLAEDATHLHVIGGNEGGMLPDGKIVSADAVTITRIAKTRLYRAVRPPMTVPPASRTQYRVASTGMVSNNEA